MQHGWLIYDAAGIKRNTWFADKMICELGHLGLNVGIKVTDTLKYGYSDGELCFFENGQKTTLPDFTIVRTIDPLLSRQLEFCGVRVFNPAYTSYICNDKRLTHMEMSKLGIPMTDTVFCDKRYFSYDGVTYPCICKSASGHGGGEVFEVNGRDELQKALETIGQNEFLLQRKVSDVGTDVRVYVLGGQIVACAKRRSRNDFRSNFSLGGSVNMIRDERIERYALSAAEQVRADFVGVDFIFDNGEPLLNEIEDVVGTRMLYTATDIDICKKYSEYIVEAIV